MGKNKTKQQQQQQQHNNTQTNKKEKEKKKEADISHIRKDDYEQVCAKRNMHTMVHTRTVGVTPPTMNRRVNAIPCRIN